MSVCFPPPSFFLTDLFFFPHSPCCCCFYLIVDFFPELRLMIYSFFPLSQLPFSFPVSPLVFSFSWTQVSRRRTSLYRSPRHLLVRHHPFLPNGSSVCGRFPGDSFGFFVPQVFSNCFLSPGLVISPLHVDLTRCCPSFHALLLCVSTFFFPCFSTPFFRWSNETLLK